MKIKYTQIDTKMTQTYVEIYTLMKKYMKQTKYADKLQRPIKRYKDI